jgi:hypothetical protein
MIEHSPNTPTPEPYKSYVEQRATSVAGVLEDIVNGFDTQLCPRAITPDEVVFTSPDAIIYGCVVNRVEQGEKSVLYRDNMKLGQLGIVTGLEEEATAYIQHQLNAGNKVRIKDPAESDGRGQSMAETKEKALELFLNRDGAKEMVLMPHLDEISDRLTIGVINLGQLGTFSYMGREHLTENGELEVYGGGDIGVARIDDAEALDTIADTFDIHPVARKRAELALKRYQDLITHAGRVSVDVIIGKTDSGLSVISPVDITPRVGGTTPAEVLAIRELVQSNNVVAYASSRLYYNPNGQHVPGMRFVDTPSLRITANIKEVR